VPELRWILIIAGVVLIAGLWWWESRKQRRPEATAAEAGPAERTEPRLGEAVPPSVEPSLPSIRVTPEDRIKPPARPPVIEIPADAEPALTTTIIAPELRVVPDPGSTVTQSLDDAFAEKREPWVRTQPLESTPDGPRRARDREPSAEPPPTKQRIVALRIVTEGERWPGALLLEAFAQEGLVHGKYSVFHRERDDGRSLFCVASMVEPGSFDPEKMPGQTFPGISLFAVLPGQTPAPEVFDVMLATSRRLAERLDGLLQDETGSSLSGQRVLTLREELAHFEHLHSRARPRRG